MGLLESILKRQVRRIVNNAIDEAVDNTVGAALRDAFGQNGTEGTQNFSESSNPSVARRSSGPSGENLLRRRLQEVFAQDYPDYEVRQDLDAGVPKSRKYSYGLYYNGMPRMMIMVIDDRNHANRKDVRLAREASASYGVPYLDFYTHLPNEVEYIRNRIRENM